MVVQLFTFNPVQENTYLLYDETKACIIIDAGCYTSQEQDALLHFIEQKSLSVKRILNTHGHFDHVFGNAFLAKHFGLLPEGHQADEVFIDTMESYTKAFGFTQGVFPQKMGGYLSEGDKIVFGNTELIAIHVPGHSPGSLCYYCEKDGVLFSGDVLFKSSIGRTDLLGGDFAALINGITEKLVSLPDQTVVYPGHGPATTIGYEKINNPYL